MTVIDLEDQFVFRVPIKNKGIIFIDGMELIGRYTANPNNENLGPDDVAAMVRSCSWSTDGTDISTFNTHELVAVADRVSHRMSDLGKESGQLPSSPEPTASAPAASTA